MNTEEDLSSAKIDSALNERILKKFFSAQDSLVIQAADLSLGSLAQMVDSKAIDTEPKYQRRHRWPAEKQSALIESFLLNIPVPPIYLAEDKLGRYSVVDGKQRLTAISDFIGGRLELTSLESMEEVEGLTFAQLPEELQNALTIRPYLRVITILKQSSPLLKYEVFIRLNRGGESMEPQELRNVAFRGQLNDLIYELSENPFLRRQLKIESHKSASYQIMADAELVLRFLALRKNWSTFSGGLRTAMDSFMARNATASHVDLAGYRGSFERAVSACELLWGVNAFRRPSSSGWRDQFLNGVYDAQMLAVDELSDAEINTLSARQADVLDATAALFADTRFDRAAREATNTPGRIKYRVKQVIDALSALA
ncbi:DUF262 domain-containing protein [Thermomonas sp.]|uniref:DUF262 domain-containing protein n=1 Tax=Thermomonas sp. TaxID=1971895 RepID=UPI0035B2642F